MSTPGRPRVCSAVLASIPGATAARRISEKPASIRAPSRACLGIARSIPRCATCRSPASTWDRCAVPSLCWTAPRVYLAPPRSEARPASSACAHPEHRSPEPERPRWEIAAIIRLYGDPYRQTPWVSPAQHKVLDALVACRTAQLGGHADYWPQCGFARYASSSCRNRHGPTSVRRSPKRAGSRTAPLSSCRCRIFTRCLPFPIPSTRSS